MGVLIVFLSCTKEIDVLSIRECHKSQNLDSTSVDRKLVGSWKWERQYCFEGRTKKADKNITVTFRNDHTFSVNEGSIVHTQGTWGLQRDQFNNMTIVTSVSSEYLHGDIFFCGSQVLFNGSNMDGCDNLFEH
jgi:hypothetical protein